MAEREREIDRDRETSPSLGYSTLAVSNCQLTDSCCTRKIP